MLPRAHRLCRYDHHGVKTQVRLTPDGCLRAQTSKVSSSVCVKSLKPRTSCHHAADCSQSVTVRSTCEKPTRSGTALPPPQIRARPARATTTQNARSGLAALASGRTERRAIHPSTKAHNRRYALPHTALSRKRVSARTAILSVAPLTEELARVEVRSVVGGGGGGGAPSHLGWDGTFHSSLSWGDQSSTVAATSGCGCAVVVPPLP
jgi:hypothetical protein